MCVPNDPCEGPDLAEAVRLSDPITLLLPRCWSFISATTTTTSAAARNNLLPTQLETSAQKKHYQSHSYLLAAPRGHSIDIDAVKATFYLQQCDVFQQCCTACRVTARPAEQM